MKEEQPLSLKNVAHELEDHRELERKSPPKIRYEVGDLV
jgi:hypothetical protein